MAFRRAATVTFGRYKGQAVSAVPDDYLDWLAGLATLVDAAKQEIEDREAAKTANESWLEKIINTGFRELAKKHHPDAGGDPEDFKQLQAAKSALMSALREVGGGASTH